MMASKNKMRQALQIISHKTPYQACRLCVLLDHEECENFDKHCFGTISRQVLAKDNFTAMCNAAKKLKGTNNA